MENNVIQTINLTKKFGDFTAVDNISLEIGQGEIFGLLGPNGAGKTTTISMLATILKHTSGSATVCDHDIDKDKDGVRKCIGIVFQDPSLDDQLTAKENLDFHGRLYKMNGELRRSRIEEVLKLVELYDKKDDLVKTFSGGMKRRLEIARGLMHHPRVLFLDEPTLGLDPQTRRGLWEYIENLNKNENITIILTTHYMDEADYLCKRIAIVDHGKIIALDTPDKLKDVLGGDVITIEVSDPEKLKTILEKEEYVKDIKQINKSLNISVENGGTSIPRIIEIANTNNISVDSTLMKRPSLEDVFIHYTGRRIREEGADNVERMRMQARFRGR